MKNIFYLSIVCFFIISCQNEDIERIIVPTVENLEIDIFSSQDECGYTVLNNFDIGAWNSSTILSGDGNVLLSGRGNERFSESQMTVVKTTTTGEVIYFKVLFADRYGDAEALAEDSEQNIYVAGTTYLEEEAFVRNFKFSVAKLDPNGAILWEKIYHTDLENLRAERIAILPNDEIIISGTQDNNLTFLQLNPEGEELGFEIMTTPPNGNPDGMLVLEDGRILITSSLDSEVVLSWYDSELNLLMTRSYPDTRRSSARSTTQLRDGSLLTVGYFIGAFSTDERANFTKVLVMKTNPEGEVIWLTAIGDDNFFNQGQSIRENQDGSIVLNGASLNNHMLIYLDADGNEINARYFTDDKTSGGQNLIKLANGRNILTGRHTEGTFFLNTDNFGR